MPTLLPLKGKDLYSSAWDTLSQFLTPDLGPKSQFAPEEIEKFGQALASAVMPKTQEEAVESGVMGLGGGAVWVPTTKNFLKKLSQEHYNALSPVDKRVLDLSTEAIPSVRNAELYYGVSDGFYAPPAATTLPEYLKRLNPGGIQLTDPQNYIGHRLEKRLSSPAIALMHEGGAGHALTGGSKNLSSWGKFTEPNYTMYDNPSRLAVEGFAEGGSHAAMNKYNKEVFAPYWQEYKDYPSDLKDIYIKSGYLGADVGSDLRKGTVPNQEKVIQELLAILKGVY